MTRAADEESRRYPHWRRNRWVFPFANVLCGFGFSLAWPFVPLMVRGLGVRENLETWVGAMLLAFYLVSTAASPIWGGIADHYGRKPMVLRAMLGMGVTMLLAPFAPTPLWFAAALMLVAVFNGFTPAGVSLLVANTPPGRIGSAVSLAQTGGQVGHALGPAAGAALAALLDRQHALYWISGGVMLSGGLLVLMFVREVKQLAPGPWRPRLVGSLRELLAVPRVAPLFLLAFLFSIMFQFLAMGVAPFFAGLVGPALGLRAYFAITTALMLGGLALWLRGGKRLSLKVAKITDHAVRRARSASLTSPI